jgi:hypothetical protein
VYFDRAHFPDVSSVLEQYVNYFAYKLAQIIVFVIIVIFITFALKFLYTLN